MEKSNEKSSLEILRVALYYPSHRNERDTASGTRYLPGRVNGPAGDPIMRRQKKDRNSTFEWRRKKFLPR